ncbi:hypothetical protein [Mycobacterium hubeiense]|uniref:hypothetical protein n=1 Tax=Mycobacterium hubeiense TaxID=1867256 RepID=UPI000C7EC108|nr:hypothetical protein [Mycobacterium sp. QGD 101]
MPVADGPAARRARSGALPAMDSSEFEALAWQYWAWTARACGGSTEPDPLGGGPIPLEFQRWL